MLTNIKDIDDQILLQLDGKTLCHFKSINNISNNYFNSEFWVNKFRYDHIPIIDKTNMHHYTKGIKYIKLTKMLFIIMDIDKCDNIYIDVSENDDLKNLLNNTVIQDLYHKIPITYNTIRIERYGEACSIEFFDQRSLGTSPRIIQDVDFNTVFLFIYKAFYYNLYIDDNNEVLFVVEHRNFECNHPVKMKYHYERYGQYKLLSHMTDTMFNTLYNQLKL